MTHHHAIHASDTARGPIAAFPGKPGPKAQGVGGADLFSRLFDTMNVKVDVLPKVSPANGTVVPPQMPAPTDAVLPAPPDQAADNLAALIARMQQHVASGSQTSITPRLAVPADAPAGTLEKPEATSDIPTQALGMISILQGTDPAKAADTATAIDLPFPMPTDAGADAQQTLEQPKKPGAAHSTTDKKDAPETPSDAVSTKTAAEGPLVGTEVLAQAAPILPVLVNQAAIPAVPNDADAPDTNPLQLEPMQSGTATLPTIPTAPENAATGAPAYQAPAQTGATGTPPVAADPQGEYQDHPAQALATLPGPADTTEPVATRLDTPPAPVLTSAPPRPADPATAQTAAAIAPTRRSDAGSQPPLAGSKPDPAVERQPATTTGAGEAMAASAGRADALRVTPEPAPKAPSVTPIRSAGPELRDVAPEPTGKTAPADPPPAFTTDPAVTTLDEATAADAAREPNGADQPAIDVLHPEWEAELIDRVTSQITGDGAVIEIALSPDQLGGVEVRLEMSNGRAEVAFVTETADAARLFTQSESRLADLLQRQGFDLSGQTASQRQDDRRDADQRPEPMRKLRNDPAEPAPSGPEHPTGLLNLIA